MLRTAWTYSNRIEICFGALRNLKGIRHVHDAGHTRQIAFRLGVGGRAVLEVFLLLEQRLGTVGDLVSLDDALPRRHASFRDMVLDVPGRRIHGLPDAREVRLAVGRPPQPVGSRCGRLPTTCGLEQRRTSRGTRWATGSHVDSVHGVTCVTSIDSWRQALRDNHRASQLGGSSRSTQGSPSGSSHRRRFSGHPPERRRPRNPGRSRVHRRT